LEQQIESERVKGRKEWNYEDAYLFWMRQRAYPNDTVDWTAYATAFLRQALMPKARLKVPPGFAQIAPPRWEFVGPQNLPVPYRLYYGQGSTSGRVNGVAFDPSQDGVIYIASAGGGLWKWKKTDDGGGVWTAFSDGWKNLRTSSVAIDPTRPERMFVGTGDFDGGKSVYGYGVQRSLDGGQHWTIVAARELDGLSARRILVDADNPDIITIASGRNPSKDKPGKLLRSENGGDTWQEVAPPTIEGSGPADWQDLKCGIKNRDGIRWCYAAGASNGGEVVRTSDHGKHWEKIRPPIGSGYQQSLAVATSRTDADTVYLLSGSDEVILKSNSHGDTWANITNSFPAALQDMPDYNWRQSNYDFFIETSTNPVSNQEIIYVGLVDIVASLDGGKSWVSVGRTYQADALTHNDQHCFAVNPRDPNQALLGNDGGVYGLTFDPATTSWNFRTDLSKDLGLTQFYKVAIHPTDPSFLVGGAQDNASPASTGDLKNWRNVGGGDGGFTAISASVPDTQYATTQGMEIYRTKTSWSDWDPDSNDCCITYSETIGDQQIPWGGDPTSFIAPIILDPTHQNLLYAGTNYLWRWDENNPGWAKHLGDQILAEPGDPKVPQNEWDTIATIAVAPSDSNRIYTASQTGLLWLSTAAGEKGSWKRIDSTGSGLPTFWMTDVAVHPTNPDTVLIALSGTAGKTGKHPGHVWRCIKMSSDRPQCRNISGTLVGGLPNIPANSVIIDPGSPDSIYYVGTDIGVFVTKDGGVTWGDAGQSLGLPNVQVNHLVFQPKGGYLFAATFGRGIWRLKLPSQFNPTFLQLVMREPSISATIKKTNTKQGNH
jgi:hypothetical protein